MAWERQLPYGLRHRSPIPQARPSGTKQREVTVIPPSQVAVRRSRHWRHSDFVRAKSLRVGCVQSPPRWPGGAEDGDEEEDDGDGHARVWSDQSRAAEGKGQLAAGTCEIVTLDRDSSQPRRTIARQTARCACKKGQIAGTTRARPACVDAAIVRKKQWCEMVPCLEDEGCDLLVNKSGWTCTQPGGRVKTTTAL
ncbi:chemokine-like protein TAFA-5a isoform X1 [Syngnathoides biaculeatus]|uniref:chemokine-like protein TAFA-5a isoform X1 n=1 Tax=Syngnathoides biaculeatus TaxID=300417 RepID=UPI002ADD46E7|nr:chemokine-like protein TAFA-5a isoform X1 [Syngnathoides biaculeatus]XP_061662622.1 chemokine-like protein TAFA-5a isoform X1 [Syngnathoides biaculeatus]